MTENFREEKAGPRFPLGTRSITQVTGTGLHPLRIKRDLIQTGLAL